MSISGQVKPGNKLAVGRSGPAASITLSPLDFLTTGAILPGCDHISVRSKKLCLRRQHPDVNHRY
ncbi:hypothetical protein [Candidatus Poriferisocius sp.]|uniref:hypothetical protein n=1 Tax=Candidatus Poriferisocius sp. TaxID=3101276 RepID=UPI003B01EFFD